MKARNVALGLRRRVKGTAHRRLQKNTPSRSPFDRSTTIVGPRRCSLTPGHEKCLNTCAMRDDVLRLLTHIARRLPDLGPRKGNVTPWPKVCAVSVFAAEAFRPQKWQARPSMMSLLITIILSTIALEQQKLRSMYVVYHDVRVSAQFGLPSMS